MNQVQKSLIHLIMVNDYNKLAKCSPARRNRKKKMLEPKLNPLTSNNDEGFKVELIIWGEINDLDAYSHSNSCQENSILC